MGLKNAGEGEEMQDEMNSVENSDYSPEMQEEQVSEGSLPEGGDESENGSQSMGSPDENIDGPKGIKARLGRERKKHAQQMAEMQRRMDMIQQQMISPYYQQSSQQQAQNMPLSEEERIQRGVDMALAKREQAEKQRYIENQHRRFDEDLDRASDVYEDFDDVVRDDTAPFTPSMREAAMVLPNAPDVLYKLGKNREELHRIARLHPLDQAKEMVKLSVALLANKKNVTNAPRPIGNIKSSPTASTKTSPDGKTSVSELRRRLKNNWK